MSQDAQAPIVPLLSRALQRIRSTPPRIIASPPTQPRRAAVALIIRVVPSPHKSLPAPPTTQPTLQEFFALEWVNDPQARPEILFLQRENPAKNGDGPFSQAQVRQAEREAHVAFPGGRMEPDDEGGLYTAMRQTWEELGIDLAEKDYISIGQLDDREITTSLGKRLLMILSPFVFLQVTPQAAPADPVPTTQLHWTPLASLISPNTKGWSSVTVDAASRLTPKHSALLRVVVRMLVGTMQFPAIVIQPSGSSAAGKEEKRSRQSMAERGALQLKLWGLSLGMTLDLMSYMILPTADEDEKSGTGQDYFEPRRRQRGGSHSAPSTPLSEVMQLPYQDSTMLDFRMEYVAPSLASVFPRFSYPDVNFWIWVFGKRYREVIRGWESSVRAGGVNDRRINWSGSALNTFYAAIRKALIVVIVGRALGILVGLGFALWWVLS